jgi:hypothetical protein
MFTTPLNLLFNATNSTCGRMCFILPRITITNNCYWLEYETVWVEEISSSVTCWINWCEFDIDTSDLKFDNYRYTPENGEKTRKQKIIFLKNNQDWEKPDFDKIKKELDLLRWEDKQNDENELG